MNETLYHDLIEFISINGYFTIPVLGIIGLVTNLICLGVFCSDKFKDKGRFKYVVLKVIIDMFGCIYSIGFQNYFQCLLEPHILKTNKCVSSGSLFFIVIRLYVYRYASYMFYLWSGINEVLVNYDRYLVLRNKKNWFNGRYSFAIITTISGLVSFSSFIPNLFAYRISLVNNQTDIYFIERTLFGKTAFFQLYVLVILSISNILSSILLILTGFMLLYEFRKYRLNLSTMRTRGHQTSSSRQEILRRKVEIKIIKMVLSMSFLFTVLRLWDLAYTLNNSLFLLNMASNIRFFVYFSNFWYIWGNIVLNANIFILIKFNRIFRTTFISYARSTFLILSPTSLS